MAMRRHDPVKNAESAIMRAKPRSKLVRPTDVAAHARQSVLPKPRAAAQAAARKAPKITAKPQGSRVSAAEMDAVRAREIAASRAARRDQLAGEQSAVRRKYAEKSADIVRKGSEKQDEMLKVLKR
jgi:hypothetical protein